MPETIHDVEQVPPVMSDGIPLNDAQMAELEQMLESTRSVSPTVLEYMQQNWERVLFAERETK